MAGSTPASPSADLAVAGAPAYLGLDPAPASTGSHLVSDGTAAVASAYPALAAAVPAAAPDAGAVPEARRRSAAA